MYIFETLKKLLNEVIELENDVHYAQNLNCEGDGDSGIVNRLKNVQSKILCQMAIEKKNGG